MQDLFDSVISLEADAFEEGRQEGLEDARLDDMFDTGKGVGFIRAFALGLEVGFIETAGSLMLSNYKIKERELLISPTPPQPPPHGPTLDSVEGGEGDSETHNDSINNSNSNTTSGISRGSSIRSMRRVVSMIEKVQQTPDTNETTVDFDAQVRELRALYRLCGSNVGPFYRPSNGNVGGAVGDEANEGRDIVGSSVSREW